MTGTAKIRKNAPVVLAAGVLLFIAFVIYMSIRTSIEYADSCLARGGTVYGIGHGRALCVSDDGRIIP